MPYTRCEHAVAIPAAGSAPAVLRDKRNCPMSRARGHAKSFLATRRPSSPPDLGAGSSAFRFMTNELSSDTSVRGGFPCVSSGAIALGRSSAVGLGSFRGAVGRGSAVKYRCFRACP